MNDDGITKSNDPKLAAARVFIGNLPSDRTTKEDLQEKFKPYGKILGISIHKGYGFVQYETENEAGQAVEAEHNSIFKGQPLDLRISTQGGRRSQPMSKRPPPFKRPHEEEPSFRDNWRGDDPYGDPYWNPAERGPPPPFREPPPRDDPYWRDRYPPPHPPMIPPPRVNGAPHDPYRDDREPFPPPQATEPPGMPKKIEYGIERPFDAVIVVTQKSLKLYAEMLERRLFELNMTVDMIFLIHDGALNKAIDDMTRRGVLYILVVQPQHEEHKSITVNIMHGTPQEHRNMPLEDALVMMARNFNSYLSSLRNGSEQPTMGFLLNLLADGKHLSVIELERIIAHLQDRRDRLIEGEGGHKDPQTVQQQPANQQNAAVNSPSALQQKILGILGNTLLNQQQTSGVSQQSPSAPPALALANLAQQFGINISQSAPQNQQQSPAPKIGADGSSKLGSSLNDANVKKTLDSLLQNPNLLKSLVPQASSLQKSAASTAGGSQQPTSLFGPGGGNFVGVPQQQATNNPNQGPPPIRPPLPQLNPNLFGQNFADGQQQRGGGQQFHGGYGNK